VPPNNCVNPPAGARRLRRTEAPDGARRGLRRTFGRQLTMNTNTQDRQFLEMIRRFLARAAITASAVRNQGGAGVAERAREAAFSLDLGRFASAQDFAKHLDDATEEMKAALPRPARTWGLSRKLVNIFLRDCL